MKGGVKLFGGGGGFVKNYVIHVTWTREIRSEGKS